MKKYRFVHKNQTNPQKLLQREHNSNFMCNSFYSQQKKRKLKIKQTQNLHIKDLNSLTTAKISCSQNKNPMQTESQKYYHTVQTNKEQAQMTKRASNIQKLKIQAKYLQNSQFMGPYVTQFPEQFENQENQYDFPGYLIHNQFLSTKKIWKIQQARTSLKTRRKTFSCNINYKSVDQNQQPQANLLMLKYAQKNQVCKVNSKKKDTHLKQPLMAKKYYRVTNKQKQELSNRQIKSSLFKAIAKFSKNKNKMVQQLIGVNINKIKTRHKQYDDYVIICL